MNKEQKINYAVGTYAGFEATEIKDENNFVVCELDTEDRLGEVVDGVFIADDQWKKIEKDCAYAMKNYFDNIKMVEKLSA